MDMTITQKILAKHAGLNKVEAGDLLVANLDLVMSNDATFPISIAEYKRGGFSSVFDSEKIALVMDHFTPNKDIKAAENCRIVREFAAEHAIRQFYDVGRMGIEHVLLPEKGLVAPGELIIGGDSHTCTYGALGAVATGMGSTDICIGVVTGKAWFKVPSAIKIVLTGNLRGYASGKDVILHILSIVGVNGALNKSIEYYGDGIKFLSIDDRFTIANMAIECGATNAIFPVDAVTLDYLEGRVNRPYEIFTADSDATYDSCLAVDLRLIQPMVALPSLPSNSVPVSELEQTKIDAVFIGSCTNGRLSDLAAAARVLKGRKVNSNVRVIVVPATQAIYLDALRLGYIETFIKANCAVATPGCAACGGGHMGLMGKDEVVLSTSNRNFVGRMGHIDSRIFLCSPHTAAVSALTGFITTLDDYGEMI